MNSPTPNETLRRRLDLVEQLVVLALYGWLVARLWPAGPADAGALAISLLLISEGFVCLLLLIRRRTSNISVDLRDWIVAAAGTFLPLLVGKGGSTLFPTLGACLILGGMLVHLGAKLSLRRSFGLVAANRGVKVGGLYAVMRHPMYAGYMLGHVGYLLAAPSFWNLAIYISVWSLLIARINAEERVLLRDERYTQYSSSVRYKLLPGLY